MTQGLDEFEIEFVQDEARFGQLAQPWRELMHKIDSDFCYFQSYDWCATWWAHVGRLQSTNELHVCCLWLNKQLCAVWPLMRTRTHFGARTLVPLTSPHIEYSNLLVDPQAVSHAQLAEFTTSIISQKNIDLVSLPKVPEGTSLFNALGTTGQAAPVDEIASIFDLSDITSFDQTQKGLSKNGRKRRKQRRAKLEKLGALTYQTHWGSSNSYKDLVAQAFEFKRTWLEETGRNDSKFLIDGYQACIAALAGDATSQQGAVAGVLTLDQTPVAVEIGFVQAGHYYAYIGAFDWSMRDQSVGKVQMEETLNWAIESNLQKYDLLAEPADYKDSWSNHRVQLTSRVIPKSIRGQLLGVVWQNHLRPFVKKQFNALPGGVRTKILNARRTGDSAQH